MTILLYIILFIMGIYIGSFVSTAAHRIPLNQSLIKKKSYCPKCNHKLEFADTVPIISYIIYGGRCRYCKSKISPRYILLELFTGIAFVFIAMFFEVDATKCEWMQVFQMALAMLYLIFILLIAEIDREKQTIDTRVLIYGTIITIFKLIFEYHYDNSFNARSVIINLVVLTVILLVDVVYTQRKNRHEYLFNLLIFIVLMNIFLTEIVAIMAIICTLLIIFFRLLLAKIMTSKKNSQKELCVAQYLALSNIIVALIIFFV